MTPSVTSMAGTAKLNEKSRQEQMVQASPPSPLREEDYEAIEAAVMETARGRWFLSQYTQRNRSADTNILLEAIQKLDMSMKREHKGPQINRIQLDLADMQEAIARTKREIAQIKHESEDGDRFTEASNELDAIINQTEGATQDILNTAEKIQELAWTLREQGVDDKVCDDIDAHTTEIYMACSFQDLTGQRTQKVVQVLRYLESRINEMMNIWGLEDSDIGKDGRDPLNPEDQRPDAHLLNGPQMDNKAINQNDIDALMDFSAATGAGDDMADVIEHDPDETPAIDLAEDSADDAGGDSEADDDTNFTFIGETADAEQQADVFASAEEEAAVEAVAEPLDASGADVFSSGEAEAVLAEMAGVDNSETDDTFGGFDVAETDDTDAMADADDMSDAVSELTTGESADDEAVADDIDMVDAMAEVAASDEDEDDLDENKADALFSEMDGADEDEETALQAGSDDTDPLSSLSTGERLALFS